MRGMKPTVAWRIVASAPPGAMAELTSKAHPKGNAAQPVATAPVSESTGASTVKGPGSAPASCRSMTA